MKFPIILTPKRVAVFTFLVSLVVSSGLLLILHFSSKGKSVNPRENHQNRFLVASPETEEKREYINVLLMGMGGAGHSGGTLADTMIVANINYTKMLVTFIAIPRDLWVQIPVSSDKREAYKINATYAIGQDDEKYPLKEPMYRGSNGGGNLAMKIVSDVTNMPIDFYVAVDFGGFQNAIDAVGGLDVNVVHPFEDKFYPVKGLEDDLCGKSPEEMQKIQALYTGFELEKHFECRYETLTFQSGVNHMDGTTALKFVRSRHSNEYGGDFARGERQQALLIALINKLVQANAVDNIPEFFDKFKSSVRTDITVDDILDYVEAYGDPSGYETKSFGLSTDNVLTNATSADGQYILNPASSQFNWSGIQKFIQENLTK